MTNKEIENLLERALAARGDMLDEHHEAAVRLFNGFFEGAPALVVDLYASTILIHNYADPAEEGEPLVQIALQFYLQRLPWVRSVVLKTRNAASAAKQGQVISGEQPARRIKEHGVWYAIDLLMNRDASFYLDTRNLRDWARNTLGGKTVLNTFAYTGSLGVAAQAGGAARVVHLDLNRRFLNVAKDSYTLNGFPIEKRNFQTGDFWSLVNQLKRAGERFDCVFLDPPFFAATKKGRVDLLHNSTRLINKVRPLINHGGYLVAINNALFLAGTEYMAELEALCGDGYVQIKQLIPVPRDVTGYPESKVRAPILDPAPFNHATKIAVLEVRHKQS